ncbi:serine hydrolase domain-containing protein [Vaginisenegalia massiliensis]|uniref:serine hydrolase domain-containing protein n=1 Tax=Vaginisenegalia massiliensis TaxID=2058294 RepID=UPI000F5352A7|nr:serine hydrolase domain-containing protein [Vaginisenegalia massiliensis]
MKSYRKLLLVMMMGVYLFSGMGMTAVQAEADFSKDILESKLKTFMDQRRASTASVSMVFFKEGQIILEKQDGFEDMDKQRRVSPDSVYEWGSVSKALVWVSIMQLVEQGKLDLRQSALDYLPADFKAKMHFKADFTLLDLMNHQAGFQETVYQVEYSHKQDIPSLKDQLISSQPAQIYQPGSVTAYSNWSTALAAYIVQEQSGQPYYQYVKDHIFQPLAMTHTSAKADWSDNAFVAKQRNKMQTYYLSQENHENLGSSLVYIGLYPAGSCTGTIGDFGKFASQFTAKTSPLFQKTESLRAFQEASSTYSQTDLGRNFHGLWSIDPGQKLIGHGGNTQGFSSAFWFDPQSKTGYAVMTNEVGETTYNYGLATLLYGAYPSKKGEGADISGVYAPRRTIEQGFGRLFKYMSSLMPIQKTATSGEFKIPLVDFKVISLGHRAYLQDSGNGLAFLMFQKADNQGFESYTTDYQKLPWWEIGTAVILLLVLVLNVLVGLFWLGRAIYKRILRRPSSLYNWANLSAHLAAMMIGGIFLYWQIVQTYQAASVQFWGIINGLCAGLILTNLLFQVYNKAKQQNRRKDLLAAILPSLSMAAVLFFQMYRG